jgi:hypothetical protein
MAKYKVPFDPEGNLMHDVDWYCGFDKSNIDWRDPEPFHAWLSIEEMYRSGHSVYYTWIDGVGRTYPMLVSDLLELLKTTDIIDRSVNGNWTIVKRGRAYGIRKVPNDQDD